MLQTYTGSTIPLNITLQDQSGNALNLSGGVTVNVAVISPSGNRTSLSATVTGNGQCYVTLTPSIIGFAGVYEYQAEVIYPTSGTLYSDTGTISVERSL